MRGDHRPAAATAPRRPHPPPRPERRSTPQRVRRCPSRPHLGQKAACALPPRGRGLLRQNRPSRRCGSQSGPQRPPRRPAPPPNANERRSARSYRGRWHSGNLSVIEALEVPARAGGTAATFRLNRSRAARRAATRCGADRGWVRGSVHGCALRAQACCAFKLERLGAMVSSTASSDRPYPHAVQGRVTAPGCAVSQQSQCAR